MKKRALRPLAAIMAAILLASAFAGCKKDPGNDPNNPSGADTPEFVYVPEYIALPEGVTDISNLCLVGDKLYFSSQVLVDEETYTYANKLFSMGMDGTGLTELPGYVPMETPEGMTGNAYIQRMCSDGDGNLWVMENGYFYIYEEPGDVDPDTGEAAPLPDAKPMPMGPMESREEKAIRKLDATGAELLTVDVSGLSGDAEYFYINSFNIDGKDNIYLACDTGGQQTIMVLDSGGKTQFKLEVTNWVEQLIRMPDGSVAFSGYAENGYALKKIDFAAKTWGEEIKLPQNMYNVYPGGGEYALAFGNNNSLYGLAEGVEEPEKLLSWLDCDISNDGLSNITLLSDGRVMCTNYTWNNATETQSFELIVLTKQPYASLPQRTVLTLATMWLDWNLRSAIVNFNKTNGTYRIQVNDYSEYNTEEDYNAGLTKLSTEIISGKIPDILDVSNLPAKQYVAKGLLEDLYPYIESDAEFSRSDFIESAFRAVEMNGSLYQIFPNFGITTLAGHPSVLGESMGWNMDEFREVLKANPQADMPMGMWMTKENFLQYAVLMGMDEYVDWAAGKCYFDNGSFASLLEFANTFPKEFVYDEETYVDETELIASGRQIMMMYGVSDFQNTQYYKALLGGEIVFKGFPSENRNGHVLSASASLSMTSRCADKEGAWAFMRTILTADWQRTNMRWNFPTNKTVFDEMLAEAMKQEYYTDEEGKEVPIPKSSYGVARAVRASGGAVVSEGDSDTIEIYALTQEEADQIMELINAVSGTYSYDESLLKIINEGAADYFSGKNSAQQAAGIIQSRAAIYISEQS